MTNAPQPRVSRRTLAAGTAWAVPAITLAAAAPAMAASPSISLNSACNASCGGTSMINITNRTTNTANLWVYMGMVNNGPPLPSGTTFCWRVTLTVNTSDAAGMTACTPAGGTNTFGTYVGSPGKLGTPYTYAGREVTPVYYDICFTTSGSMATGSRFCFNAQWSGSGQCVAPLRSGFSYPGVSLALTSATVPVSGGTKTTADIPSGTSNQCL